MQKKFSRSFDEIAHLVAETEHFFADEGVNPGLRTAVDLCIEELFVNMVKYNKETTSDIELGMKSVPGGIEVSLTDFDVERFDPTVSRDVDTDAPLAERTPGGLGVYLVLKMVDSIHYQYHDRQSKITFQIKMAKDDV
jgi:anti-sigma regulatory factor (Ser/Thr protein kinase)